MRALYWDAPILLLDEPTSALDADAEATFVRVLQKLRDAGKTIIVAAHNLRLLAAADCVVEMRGGRIAAQTGPAAAPNVTAAWTEEAST